MSFKVARFLHLGLPFCMSIPKHPKLIDFSSPKNTLSPSTTGEKANVVADALSRKSLHLSMLMIREFELLEQFRDFSLVCEATHSCVKLGMLKLTCGILDEIREGQKSDLKLVDVMTLINQDKGGDFRIDENGIMRCRDRVCVPDVADLRKRILEEGHRSGLSIHPGATKMYQDLRKMFWWQGLQSALGTKLRLSSTYHLQTDGQTERTIQSLEDLLRSCVLEQGGNWDNFLPLIEFTYNNSFHSSIEMAPFEALYEKMKASQSHQKSYHDKRRKALEFEKDEHVFLRVTPITGVGRALKSHKLTPRFIGPYQISKRVGEVAYQIALPPSLSNLHDVFHVSQLRRYIADPSHVVPLDDVQVRDNLTVDTSPMRIEDREVKRLRGKEIALVKVIWGGVANGNITWELEDKMKESYPELFV
ncbi:hypothetical protein KIW84_022495 [Lathyrus oleraceus]|uniref:Integrase catalytic domain-containing protein n=1 Tax=Pisum sativum TaxID=3888 RepID=A0A9D5BAU0_PEA|nr:hypothetical protein KIW84_022495 [Pisum sativum]